MCGIAGILSENTDREEVRRMVEVIHHRGPDASGIYINDSRNVCLGNTRLCVIDLSEQANQPMATPDQNHVIVFNGEIYNFKVLRKELLNRDNSLIFKTQSDTETILYAYQIWGPEMVRKLEGMFAIAIYDKRSNQLFLCRDRLGQKPLFYFKDSSHFIFASELKSIVNHPYLKNKLRVNREAIYDFLHLGYVPEPLTIYDSVFKFPAGYYGILNPPSNLDIHKYWGMPELMSGQNALPVNTGDSIKNLRSLLSEAVGKRMISDVPLGIFLSGGIDSGLVAALAMELSNKPLKSFTIGFRETEFNESVYAARTARCLNTEHCEFILSEKEAEEILWTYLDHFDEPFGDTSAIPTMLVSELAKKDITVALTGDGGDELFLGYGAYAWANRLDNPFWKLTQNPLSWILARSGNDRLARIAKVLRKVPGNILRSHVFSQEQYLFSQDEIRNNLLSDIHAPYNFIYDEGDLSSFNAAEKQAIFDLKYYLKDDLLVKVDRASMYHSLECRSPFLDHKVVECAIKLPYKLKIIRNTTKWILKEILRQYLPDDLINRPKWGFSIPLSKWMKNDLKFLINDHLNKSEIENTGIADYRYVNELIRLFFRGYDHLYNRLWLLIVLHKWLKKNG